MPIRMIGLLEEVPGCPRCTKLETLGDPLAQRNSRSTPLPYDLPADRALREIGALIGLLWRCYVTQKLTDAPPFAPAGQRPLSWPLTAKRLGILRRNDMVSSVRKGFLLRWYATTLHRCAFLLDHLV